MRESLENGRKHILAKWAERPRRFFCWLASVTFALLALFFVQRPLFWKLDVSARQAATFVLLGLIVGFVTGISGFLLSLFPPLRPLLQWIVRRFALLVACLIASIALFYGIEDWRGKGAWQSFKRESGAKGEKLEISEIMPLAVSDEQNIAATSLFKPLWPEFDPGWYPAHAAPDEEATNKEDRLNFKFQRARQDEPKLADWTISQRTDLAGWQDYYRNPKISPSSISPNYAGALTPEQRAAQAAFEERYGLVGRAEVEPDSVVLAKMLKEFPLSPHPQSPAADVLLALSENDSLLPELREALTRARSRFPLHYEDEFDVRIPHLARIKHINWFLALRVAAELEANKINDAAADVNLSLRLTDLLREEPLLLSQQTRVAQLLSALNPLWEGMVEHAWTDAQLAEFGQRLSRFNFLSDFQYAMRGERALFMQAIEKEREVRGAKFLLFFHDDQLYRESMALFYHLVPGGWFDQNKVSISRIFARIPLSSVDPVARRISPSKVEEQADSINRDRALSPYNWFESALPPFAKVSSKFAHGQVAVDLAQVACALERYRLSHNQYPDFLDALAPQFIEKIPHDIINGEPLKYRHNADGGFTLYSIGWDEIDGGGDALVTKEKRRNNFREGDWIWQVPGNDP